MEPLMNVLGRFDLDSERRTVFPILSTLRFKVQVTSCSIGYSRTQGRGFLLLVASLFHALFFIIIGTSRNFGEALVAFACSTFARAFFTGK